MRKTTRNIRFQLKQYVLSANPLFATPAMAKKSRLEHELEMVNASSLSFSATEHLLRLPISYKRRRMHVAPTTAEAVRTTTTAPHTTTEAADQDRTKTSSLKSG
jgi:hypothetical protein